MKTKTIGTILLTLFVVGLLVFGVFLIQMYSQPLGPTMTFSSNKVASAQIEPTSTPFGPSEPTPQPFCGQTGKMVVLVIGDDASPTIEPPGSDLVRYVQVDFSKQKVTIFTFPRGLWLNTAVLSSQNITATTLGKTYHYALVDAKKTIQDDKKLVVAASQAVAQTVLDNFGLTPDHYVAVKLSNLPQLIDTIGGVTINNPARLVTTYDPPFTFEVGTQTIGGLQTASYVRFSDATHTDWDRTARQNLVLQALYKKLEDPAIITKIPAFFTQLTDSIVTDLSPEQVADLTCVLKNVGDANIVQTSISPDMVKDGPEPLSQLPDLDRIKQLLKTLGLIS
jgi:LCP family protein required for cell wall assembly